MITYYLIAIALGIFFAYLLLYIFYYRDLLKYTSKKPIYVKTVKACPRNINRCDKCIYTVYNDYPGLTKPCQKEYEKYE